MNSERILIIGDIHGNWCDSKLTGRGADGLVFKIAKAIDIDHIFINGDLLDFINVNSHGPKHPDIKEVLEDEINWGIDFLQALRDNFPNVKITYNEGNHENRLDRFILNNCPSFWNLLRLKNMLNLERLNIEFFPYNNDYKVQESNLHIMHSPPSYGQNGARTSLLKKADSSYIFNCTHRVQHASITGASGSVYHCWFNGFLGSTNETSGHKKIFSYAKGHECWQKSMIIANMVDYDKYFVTPISLDTHACVVDGIYFEA
jgi:hypothetical protein